MNPWWTGTISAGERVTATLLGMPPLMALYTSIAFATAEHPENFHALPTVVDGWVPVIPEATLIYGFLYGQVLIPLTLLEDRRVMLRGGLAYCALLAIGLPFWLLWPVAVPRLELPITDLFSWSLTLIRAFDPPTNCFPSMHVAEAFLAALVVRRMDRPLGTMLLGVAAAIWWSTLALGQHWFLDGLAGLVMALVVDWAAFGWRPLPPEAYRSGSRARLLWAVAFYLSLFVFFTTPWWIGQQDWYGFPLD